MHETNRIGKEINMTEFSILMAVNSKHQNDHADALASGFDVHGIKYEKILARGNIRNKNVAIWGWRLGKELYLRGHNCLIMERGYIGDRFKYTAMGWNGLNNYATFPKYPDDNGERFRQHNVKIKPWKKNGEYIVIMGQVHNDASLQGNDISQWYSDIAKKAYDIYKKPVFFRPHPDAMRRGGYMYVDGLKNIVGNLDDVLESALFTIAFNSNSCLDSIIAGVPCYAGDKGTMAYDLCMKDLNNLIYPSREKKLHEISYTQWNLNEIAAGTPIKRLIECGQL